MPVRRKLAALALADTDYPLERIKKSCRVILEMKQYLKDRIELSMTLVLPGPRQPYSQGKLNRRSFARRMTSCGLSVPALRRSFGEPEVWSVGDADALEFVILKLDKQQHQTWLNL